MKRYVHDNGLTLAFVVLLVGALVGQALTGVAKINSELAAEGANQLSLAQYLRSADFGVDVAENWQSEYLQFALYIVATSQRQRLLAPLIVAIHPTVPAQSVKEFEGATAHLRGSVEGLKQEIGQFKI